MPSNVPFQRVLLPLDGSELATISVPYAASLVSPETELILCRVVPDPVPLMELAGASAFPIERIRKRKLDEAASYLDAVADVVREITPHVSTTSAIGEPPDQILGIAEEREVDLIIMATHGHGFLGRIVVGSVADRVARAASVPVMLIHPKRDPAPVRVDKAPIDRLVVPLDGSTLARQALPIATRLARQADLPIHLVCALPTQAEIEGHRDSNDAGYYEEYTSTMAEALQSEASHQRATGIAATSEVVIGPAVASILDVLDEHDVVVIASHGLGGVRRWLLGSVAERLIHSGVTPVVLVPVTERGELAAGTA